MGRAVHATASKSASTSRRFVLLSVVRTGGLRGLYAMCGDEGWVGRSWAPVVWHRPLNHCLTGDEQDVASERSRWRRWRGRSNTTMSPAPATATAPNAECTGNSSSPASDHRDHYHPPQSAVSTQTYQPGGRGKILVRARGDDRFEQGVRDCDLRSRGGRKCSGCRWRSSNPGGSNAQT